MESLVRHLSRLCGAGLLLFMLPYAAQAQSAAPPKPAAPSTVPPSAVASTSRLWIVGGGASATLRGDCQTCEEDFPYRHGGAILANIGYRVNERMDVGGELFWVPIETTSGNMHGTHFDAIAQFRPWSSKGFFVKGGAGVAFVRNWVDTSGPNAYNQKSLSVLIGAGWEFRVSQRVGVQVFGSQHAIALGDLVTSEGTVNDVMGNMWSVGAALVFR